MPCACLVEVYPLRGLGLGGGKGDKGRERDAAIRAELFCELSVMGDSGYRNDIYNSVKIFITDICENDIDKDDVGEGDKYS